MADERRRRGGDLRQGNLLGEGWVASSAPPPPPPPDSSRRPRFFECFPPPPPSLEGVLITSPLAIYVKEPGAAIPPPPPLILPLLRVDPGCDSFGRPRTGEGGGDRAHNTCGVGKKVFSSSFSPKVDRSDEEGSSCIL